MADKTVGKHKARIVQKINGLINACREVESATASRLDNIVGVCLLQGWVARVRVECEELLKRLG